MSSIIEIAQFNPATSTSTKFSVPNSAVNGTLVFFNESNVSMDLSFADSTSLYLPAWYHRSKCGYSGSVEVTWTTHAVLTSDNPPISEVVVEAFGKGETYPADGPLVRQVNGTVTQNNVQFLTNQGFPPGQVVVFAEPTGDTSAEGALNFNNQGQGTLGDATYNGALAILGTDTANSFLQRNLLAMVAADANQDIAIASGRQTNSGSVSGTITLWQPLQAANGPKIVYARMSNWQSASAANFTLAVPFSNGCLVWAGGIGTGPALQLVAGGVNQSGRITTVLAATGGTSAAQTGIDQISFAEVLHTFDTVSFPANAAGHTGLVFILGD